MSELFERSIHVPFDKLRLIGEVATQMTKQSRFKATVLIVVSSNSRHYESVFSRFSIFVFRAVRAFVFSCCKNAVNICKRGSDVFHHAIHAIGANCVIFRFETI